MATVRRFSSATEAEFEQVLNIARDNRKGVIVKFGASWCGPCRRMSPIWEAALPALSGNWLIGDIDIDQSSDLYIKLKRFKMIRGVPTIMIWLPKNDRVAWYASDGSIAGGEAASVSKFLSDVVSLKLS